MPQRVLSLRTLLSLVLVTMAALGLVVSVFLVLLTTQLRRMTTTLGEAVESVHLAEQVAGDLLVYDQSRDPLTRAAIEPGLRRKLADGNRYVSTPEEAQVLAEAVGALERYLALATSPGPEAEQIQRRLGESYEAIQRLVAINLAQAREARSRALEIDRLALVLGLGIGLLVIAVVGVVLTWLRTRAFAPVFALARAMDRFEEGDRDVRAPEIGAIELRVMAHRFNEMANAISRRRQNQMAFLAGVAHDLRNPLGALRMSTASIHPGRPLPSEPEIRRVVALIDRQLQLIQRMVDDFIDTARIESGQLELRMEACDLRLVAREVLELFESTSSTDRFEIVLPDHEVMARCDPARIEQVLINLVSNAMKYSPATSRITVVLEGEGDEALLSVSDQGVGIAAEDLRHLFEPFRRTGTSSESIPGVGLGLFVVRRILQAHGGRIEVDSVPGSGSTFRVRLPRLQRLAIVAPLEAAADAS